MNSKNLLPDYEGHDLTNYNNFLLECLEKDYGDLGIHKHHILPKFMGGKNNSENLIRLSYADHIRAHLILADCFPKKSNERIKNYLSAQHILAHLQLDEDHPENLELAKKIDTSGENSYNFGKAGRSGEDNSFYGKKHTEETKAIIREKRRFQIFSPETKARQIAALIANNKKGEENPNFGKTFEERFGEERAAEIKEKLKEANKIKYQKWLLENPLIIPEGIYSCDLVINGKKKYYYRYCPNCNDIIYYANKQRCALFGLAKKNPTCRMCAAQKRSTVGVKQIKRNFKPGMNKIVQDIRTGKIYHSKNEASRKLNIRGVKFKKLFDEGILIILQNNYNNSCNSYRTACPSNISFRLH